MFRFDTRDKKPKVYNIAVLTGITAVLLAFIARDGIHSGNRSAVNGILILYLLVVLVMLISAFFKQIHYNPYSYNTIYYMGFALFVLSVLITHTIISISEMRYPDEYDDAMALQTMLGSAKMYMRISAPFILIFAIGLCISNISLIRHEGRRFVNILGIILSFLLVGGELFLFRFDDYMAGSIQELRIHELCGNLFASVYLYFECMLIGIIVANVIVSRYEPDPDKDFLIILGCGIRKDGTPTPLLRGRVDRALDFYHKQKKETGKDLIFITSGGQGPNEVISESASMKNYLMEQGIPEEQILEEDQSRDTFENMKNSREIIQSVNPEGKVAFSTTNYHVFRSGLYARRVKMRAVGMGAHTRWYFWPNASVREFVGILTEHRLKQSLIFGGMLLIYTALTLVVYR